MGNELIITSTFSDRLEKAMGQRGQVEVNPKVWTDYYTTSVSTPFFLSILSEQDSSSNW